MTMASISSSFPVRLILKLPAIGSSFTAVVANVRDPALEPYQRRSGEKRKVMFNL